MTFKELTHAAEQGDANAQYEVGNRYCYANGIPEDDTEAVKWWRIVLEKGNAKDERILKNVFFKHDVIL